MAKPEDREIEVVPLPPNPVDQQFAAFRDAVLAEIVRVFSGARTRDCIVCDGTGSVDPSARMVDWARPELGIARDEINPQLVTCPACKGSGKESRYGRQQDNRSIG